MPPIFQAGTIFLDLKAANIDGQKAKYFIGMNEANDEDDKVICFVLNTEHHPEKLTEGCNKNKEKFYVPLKKFNFQTANTSIMLYRTVIYKLEEIISSQDIKIIETVDETMARQIKNCIDKESIEPFAWELINASFKIKKN
ncbi:MAG TPA: hypothetical protein VGK25_00675 [Ignavibacteria bacterium]